MYWDGGVEARGMTDAGDESVKADGRRCPKCGAVIKYLYYWEKAVNIEEYWPDGFHIIRTDHVIKFYFMCPECRKILFSHEEATRKFLKGQLKTG